MTEAAAVQQSEADGLSEIGRLGNIFVAPSVVFQDLIRRPRWIVPLLLMAVMSLAFAYTIDHRVGFPLLAHKAMEQNPSQLQQIEQMPGPERAKLYDRVATGMKYGFYGGPVFVLIIVLLVAVALMGVFNFGLGCEVGFKATLAIVTYSFLIRNLVAVLAIAALMMPGFDPDGFNLQVPAATNLAAFLDPATTNKAFYALLSWFDAINIWTVVVLGIGFAVAGKKKNSTGIGVMLGIYAFLALIATGWRALTW